jgi:hypothetical protein
VPDSDDPHAIVRGYLDVLAPGSFLVVSDTIMEATTRCWRRAPGG